MEIRSCRYSTREAAPSVAPSPHAGPASASSVCEKGAASGPEETFQAAPASASEIEQLSTAELRRRAGVKPRSFLKRVGGAVGQFFQAARLALTIGPALGHVVVARELSRLEAMRKGENAQPPLDWLRDKRPQVYAQSMGAVLHSVSGPVQQALGLSLTGLQAVEEHYYKALAPVTDEEGVKTTSPFLQELAKMPYRAPGEPSAAFVFLGEEKQAEADSVSQLWNSPERPKENPFPSTDQRHIIWNTLESSMEKGKLPVFVDLDGDYSTFTGTEFIAKRTLESISERHNPLGGDFADPGQYLAWLTVRQEALSRDLDSYFQRESPEASGLVASLREELQSPWLGGATGLGPWSDRITMAGVPDRLDKLREERGSLSFADAVVAMDRDMVTGLQSLWVKTVRESSTKNRERLLAPLPEAYLELNLTTPEAGGFAGVAPRNAPEVRELLPGDSYETELRPYDRSVELGEVLDRTLSGLGVAQRRWLKAELRAGVQKSLPAIEAREGRLREQLPGEYQGLDLVRVLEGRAHRDELRSELEALHRAARSEPRSELGIEARRHAELLEMMGSLDTRFGDLEPYLERTLGAFGDGPVGISEHFLPPAVGTEVTPVRSTRPLGVRMGSPEDPEPLKLSQVFEGGGGRGFAYVECLKQVEAALAGSDHGYEIDEYIGTSAGSMMAVLLAAGYRSDELREIVERLDFKSFNSDAAWLFGGADPKARGMDRTGLFSTQKMYQTFQELLSDKLGIEGRPVLFSDLPHKLKLVTTVMNTDLPEEHPLRDEIDSDGRFVFSTDTTPNFDVAGALAASAAVPGFFQAPQFQVAERGDGGEVDFSRIQLVDGGTVDNLSISSATDDADQRSLLILPAHTQTRHPETGELVKLDTLNFDTGPLDMIDAHNRKLYGGFAPHLDDYFQRLKGSGVGRGVMAFNLARPEEQSRPVIQGSDEDLSIRSILHAQELGMPVHDKERGDKMIRHALRPPSFVTRVGADLFDRYMDDQQGEGDGRGYFHRIPGGFEFRPPQHEMTDIFDMGRSAASAVLSAGEQEYAERRFEKPLE